MRRPDLYIKDILEAIEAIERFVQGMDLKAFRENDLVASAVIRKLEIIGEATKQVPDAIRTRYLEIPWKQMAGMRDRLIHFYFGVKHELVWNTIVQDLPRLKPMLREILRDLEGEE